MAARPLSRPAGMPHCPSVGRNPSTPQAIRRADLFSRQTRPRFESWGDEHGKFHEGPALVRPTKLCGSA
jgi:hypothetical protein